MKDWLPALDVAVSTEEPCILISIVRTQGSTPRELGAKMVVSERCTFSTIGGGQFEHRCIALARKLLQQGIAYQVECFSLGPRLGQCCGGAVDVAFDLIGKGSTWVKNLIEQQQNGALVLASVIDSAAETGYGGNRYIISAGGVLGRTADAGLDDQIVTTGRRILHTNAGIERTHFTDTVGQIVTVLLEPVYPTALNIVLFGAGHVGQALVQVVAGLSCQITWVDSRKDIFPHDLPCNVVCVGTDSPESQVDAAPAGAYFLVMTHSHPLDQVICDKILKRDDFHYCGLIGSRSKRKKFEKRFRVHGLSAHVINKLTCPIGIDGISGKLPAEIAIAVAAQLMQVHEKTYGRSAQMFSPQLVAS